tara:strand:- start:313 stop:498 length:186 start_codon:yes stop_codon:yes gene_type:complete
MKYLLFLYGVISRIILRFRKWKLQNRYYELDMDMQCSNMNYKEYCKEIELLNKEHDKLYGL